jgi:mono/diheme cytochrome c family protein
VKVIAFVVRALGVLVAAVVVLAAVLLVHGYGLAHKTLNNPPSTLLVAADPSLIPRGAHLSKVICAGCHSAGGSGDTLSGGHENFFQIPDGPYLGMCRAPNLTPGGPLANASDGEVARAIREGVGLDHKPLIVMPSANLRNLSDRDLAAVLAFVRAQPAVTAATPARKLNLLAYLILGLHQAETSAQLPVTTPVPAVPESANAAYGAYFAHVIGCSDCHGPTLHGATPSQLAPKGPNIVQLAHTVTYEVFEQAVRVGVKPSGGALNPALMPWTTYSNLADVEVRALYEYLKSLPL